MTLQSSNKMVRYTTMTGEVKKPFRPGVAIQFESFSEVEAFENVVADLVDPNMSATEANNWHSRDNLQEIVGHPKIKGRQFNGRMLGIELVPMQKPYTKLLSARNNGWKLPLNVSRIGSTNELDGDYRARRCFGFHFTAQATSTGRGAIGEIQAGLWYLPVTRHVASGNIQKRTVTNGGRSVVRIVTQPRFEEENFIRLSEDSERIALDVLVANMKRPLRIGMHN